MLLCKTFAVLFSPLVLSFIFANYVFYDSKVSRAKVLLLSEAIGNRFYFFSSRGIFRPWMTPERRLTARKRSRRRPPGEWGTRRNEWGCIVTSTCSRTEDICSGRTGDICCSSRSSDICSGSCSPSTGWPARCWSRWPSSSWWSSWCSPGVRSRSQESGAMSLRGPTTIRDTDSSPWSRQGEYLIIDSLEKFVNSNLCWTMKFPIFSIFFSYLLTVKKFSILSNFFSYLVTKTPIFDPWYDYYSNSYKIFTPHEGETGRLLRS